ncbi:MAG: response regulator [Pseudomonadota bacterium]
MFPSGLVRILCVEDDPGTARLMQKTLSRAGFVVDIAHDGEKGLAMYREGTYDLLCVDHNMPGLTGLDIIRILSKERRLPPTIMITGAGDEDIVVEAFKLGAGDYVIKDSYSRYYDLMPSVIEGVLDKHRLVQEKREAELALKKAHDELEKRVEERTAELARSNQELREQHEFLNTVLESLTHPFYIVNTDDYRIIKANTASGPAAGTGRTTCYALTHGRDTPCESNDLACPLEQVKKTGRPATVEHVHHDAAGNSRVVEVHAYPIFDGDGNVAKVIEYALDITDRKAAENKLTELLETSSHIVRNMPSGLLIFQYQAPGELFLVNANNEASRLMDINADEQRGQEFDEMWPNARLQGLTPALLRTMATGEAFAAECAVFKTEDMERFFRLRAFPMPHDLLGLSFEDVTELKNLECRMHEAMAAVPHKEQETASPPAATKAQEKGLRVLLITDVPAVAGVLQKGLTKLGQGATVVSSAHQALDNLLSEEFSAIVCDLTVSETNGRQAAEMVSDFCQEFGLLKPPFVLMAQADEDKDLSSAGVDLVVNKPINVALLLEVLRKVSRGHDQVVTRTGGRSDGKN